MKLNEGSKNRILRNNTLFLVIILLSLVSCKEKEKRVQETQSDPKSAKERLDQVVVISVNAPEKYFHSLSNDSLGRISDDSPGPKFIVPSPRFSYKGSLNQIEEWIPAVGTSDTLKLEIYNDYIELSTNTPFSLQRQTYLLESGDTVVFRYENKFPTADVLNRKVDDAEMNYTRVRLKELFDNKFSSHLRMTLGGESGRLREHRKIEYKNALKDTERELRFIDSLYNAGILDSVNRAYRISATKALMANHSSRPNIRQLILEENDLQQEDLPQPYHEDLRISDSLLAFHHFRDYVKSITTYSLPTISESRNSGGKFYLDSRKRFDSILNDNRFGQFTKNFLLLDAYDGIGRDYGVEDKNKFFAKLQEEVNDRESINELRDKYNLDFSTSDKMVLRTSNDELTSYSKVIKANEGKFLFIEYWASWCTPCNQFGPERDDLIRKLKDEEVTYIRMAINDNLEDWSEINQDSNIEEYFIENANVSKVVEDLGIATIPYFMILNSQGDVVEGFAKRPGKGVFEEIMAIKRDIGKTTD